MAPTQLVDKQAFNGDLGGKAFGERSLTQKLAASALVVAAALGGGLSQAACGGGGTKEVGQLPSPDPVTGAELLAQLNIKKLQVEVTGAVSPFSGAPDFLHVFNLAGVNANLNPNLVKSLTTLASEVSGHQVAVTDVEGKVKFIVMDPVTQDVFEYIDPTHVRTDNEGWATSVFAYSTIQGSEPGAIAIHESDAKEIEALTGYQVLGFLVSEFRNTITATASTEATVDVWLDQDAYLPRSTKVLGDLNPNVAKSAAIDNNGALKLVPNRDANDQLTDGGQNIVDNTTEDAPGQED